MQENIAYNKKGTPNTQMLGDTLKEFKFIHLTITLGDFSYINTLYSIIIRKRLIISKLMMTNLSINLEIIKCLLLISTASSLN